MDNLCNNRDNLTPFIIAPVSLLNQGKEIIGTIQYKKVNEHRGCNQKGFSYHDHRAIFPGNVKYHERTGKPMVFVRCQFNSS